jgi:Kef-type K+ transport system membrane component KefB
MFALLQADAAPTFVQLLIVSALAASIPVISGSLKVLSVPVVVGEIVIGILLGGSGLGVIGDNTHITFLAELGFIYLMFLSGLEIDFSLLKRGSRVERSGALGNPITLGFAVFAGTVALALLASLLLSATGAVEKPLIMALVLSTTSVGVVLPVLKDSGLISKSFGQSVLLSALIADFSTMVLITAVVAAASGGLTPELLLILMLFVAFLAVWRLGAALRTGRWGKALDVPRAVAAEAPVRLALALMIFFVVLSRWVGAEVILGAFLSGAAVSLLSHRPSHVLNAKLGAIGFGFLVPVFFIHTGANFDLEKVAASTAGLVLVPALVAAAYAVKVLPSLLYVRVYDLRTALSAGVLLSSRLSLIIAAAAVGVRVGAVSEAVAAAVVLVAVFTCTLSPILFNKLYRDPARSGDR